MHGSDPVRFFRQSKWPVHSLRDRTFSYSARRAKASFGARCLSLIRSNAEQLGQLRDLAEYARRHGIAVIGVQLPLDLRRLELSRPIGESAGGSRDGVWSIFERSETRDLIESMGIHFVDLAGLPEAANSQAFIDAFHPGEYLVLTSLIAMLKDARIGKLLPDIDIGALEKRKVAAEAARNYFNVYGHEF